MASLSRELTSLICFRVSSADALRSRLFFSRSAAMSFSWRAAMFATVLRNPKKAAATTTAITMTMSSCSLNFCHMGDTGFGISRSVSCGRLKSNAAFARNPGRNFQLRFPQHALHQLQRHWRSFAEEAGVHGVEDPAGGAKFERRTEKRPGPSSFRTNDDPADIPERCRQARP